MGSREFYDHIWALKRHFGHMTHMLDSDWLKNLLLRSDWLLPKGAILTTQLYFILCMQWEKTVKNITS